MYSGSCPCYSICYIERNLSTAIPHTPCKVQRRGTNCVSISSSMGRSGTRETVLICSAVVAGSAEAAHTRYHPHPHRSLCSCNHSPAGSTGQLMTPTGCSGNPTLDYKGRHRNVTLVITTPGNSSLSPTSVAELVPGSCTLRNSVKLRHIKWSKEGGGGKGG